jgi:hypothetical protein
MMVYRLAILVAVATAALHQVSAQQAAGGFSVKDAIERLRDPAAFLKKESDDALLGSTMMRSTCSRRPLREITPLRWWHWRACMTQYPLSLGSHSVPPTQGWLRNCTGMHGVLGMRG